MGDAARIRRRADMTGKVAVLIGAGSDIGVALALQAARLGMKVALADTHSGRLAAADKKVRARNVETLALDIGQCDLASLRELAQRTETGLGAPWLVCNIAGPTVDEKLWGVVNGVQVFAPGLARRGRGHVVNIASGDLVHLRAAAVDVAVSHAIIGLSESLYRMFDAIRSPVGVTVACPKPNNMNLVSAARDNNPDMILVRDSSLGIFPPKELAEQIFVAVERRDFWVCGQVPQMSETTRGFSRDLARDRVRPRKKTAMGLYSEEHYTFAAPKRVTH